MGVRFREPSDSAASTATIPPSLREVLLFTTMSIIGLTVEVHIKDGSVYSGIFHTASVDKGYGVILKKARMIKKGTHASNGLNRSLIDTLVVLPENLVQVLAKSVMISADGVCDGVGCGNLGAVSSDVKSYGSSEKDTRSAYSQLHEQTKISVRQDGVRRPQEDVSNDKPGFGFHKEESVHEVQPSTMSYKLEGCQLQVKSRKENDKVVSKQLPNGTPGKVTSQNIPDSCQSQADSNAIMKVVSKQLPNAKVVSKQLPNGTSGKIASQNTSDSRCQSQAVSNVAKTAVSIMFDKTCSSSATTTPVVPVQNSSVSKSSKESKLNPGAKIFSPSVANVRSVAAPPVLSGGANVSYAPNYFPAVPLVAPQSEIGIRSFPPYPSLPLKVVSYGNVATTNGVGSGLQQYTQPIAGPIPNRLQPIRYSNQYQSIQPGPTYVQPVPQNGLMERAGQLVYLNPATHEMVPGPPPFSHAPHPHLTSHSLHFPKHEVAGVIPAPPPQLSFTPPLMANDHLPYAVPSLVPFPQPAFPSIRPVSILPYGAKYS